MQFISPSPSASESPRSPFRPRSRPNTNSAASFFLPIQRYILSTALLFSLHDSTSKMYAEKYQQAKELQNRQKKIKAHRPLHLNTHTLTSHLFFGPYIFFPLIAALTWLGGLLAVSVPFTNPPLHPSQSHARRTASPAAFPSVFANRFSRCDKLKSDMNILPSTLAFAAPCTLGQSRQTTVRTRRAVCRVHL